MFHVTHQLINSLGYYYSKDAVKIFQEADAVVLTYLFPLPALSINT